MKLLILAVIAVLARSATADPLTVAVTPKQPLIERTRAGQGLSFDLIVTSTSPATLELDRMKIQVFDAAGALIAEKLAGSGVSAVLPGPTKIAPKGTLLLMNPFHTLPAELAIAKLHVELTFVDDTKAAATHVIAADVTPKTFVPKTALRVPVKGRVIVEEGHDWLAHHRRVDLTNPIVGKLGVTTNPTRYSYDFVPVDAAGKKFKTDGKTNADFIGWGTPVVAPAAGVVKEIKADVEDNVLGGKMFDFKLVFVDIHAFYGNYVILDHGNGELSVFGHMKAGSVTAKVGDKVKAGQQIGAIGMSGDADGPHLHYQLQDGNEKNSEALPSYFKLRWVRGKASSVMTATPDSGDIIEAAP